MYRFEANFYCLFNKNKQNIMWYIGSYGATSEFTIKTINDDTNEANKFVNNLFNMMYNFMSSNQNINISHKFKYHKMFTEHHIEDNILIINLWIGDKLPECKILEVNYVQPNSKNNKHYYRVKNSAYCFEMNNGIQLYGNNSKLFLELINKFNQICTQQEHQDLLKGDKFLTFMMYQDSPYLSPYIFGYIKNINTYTEKSKLILNQCPKTHIPIEICSLYNGYFIWVKRELWMNKQNITIDDMQFGDI